MSGTANTDAPDGHGNLSAFLADFEKRWHSVEQGGDELTGETAEQRRAARRRSMEALRIGGTKAALAVADVIAGKPAENPEMFARIEDPLASLADLNRSIIQVALAEERFDETDGERALRVKAEAEAAARAEIRRADNAMQLRRAQNRLQVQSGVRAVTLTSLQLPYRQREDLLAGIFKELEKTSAYDTDPARVIADICLRLGIDTDTLRKHAAEHLTRKKSLAEAARAELEALRGDHIVDTDDEGEDADQDSGPAAHAQGPPH